MDALVLSRAKQLAELLTKIGEAGFPVAALRAWVPTRPERKMLRVIRSEPAQTTSRTNTKYKAAALQVYAAAFDLSHAAHRELKAVTDTFIVLVGRDPRTGDALDGAQRARQLSTSTRNGFPPVPGRSARLAIGVAPAAAVLALLALGGYYLAIS